MIDVHCHILPGLDDGPGTLEVAVAMVKLAHAAGTTDIVATPHANHQYVFSPELIATKMSELQRGTGNLLNIHSGCDFHLSAANIQDALRNPAKYAINHRSYVLVEFSDFLIPPTIEKIFDEMLAAGMIPVITHPERNRLLHDQEHRIRAWIEHDCLVQITAQSLLGFFGRSAKTFAEMLMKNGLVHFVASDGHDLKNRPPVLAEAYRYVADTFGAAQAESLFVTNPKAAIAGTPLAQPISVPNGTNKKWYEWGKSRPSRG
jgi:protein-tyrosine phosphatase